MINGCDRASVASQPRIVEGDAPLTLALSDRQYPERLRAIADPPAILYCDGEPMPADSRAIAIVGTRTPTPYGLRVSERLARELSELGFTVISGLARGIDGAAHHGALDAGGRTIAVLGCGLDVVYPPEHARLRAEIVRAGAVVTEFPPGSPPLASHFPRRNRIISGLSLGVVVVEASADSGSLITARCALEQGREVFAVPGPIDAPMSRGPHGLLKQGAKLVDTIDDIVEELLPQLEATLAAVPLRSLRNRDARSLTADKPGLSPGLSDDEKIVYAVIGNEPQSIDALIEKAGLSSAAVAGALLGLELKEAVRALPGQRYYRVT